MRFAIARDPLGNTEYFNGYRFTGEIGEIRPHWTNDQIRLYLTHKAASAVARELGQGIVVEIELHYSKATPNLDELDNLTLDYDGDI